jgi:Ala-tRNA(Pro) deacylase
MEIAAALFERLAALGVRTATVAHPPLHTVEESRRLRGAVPGAHTKNLFLVDKAGSLWLVTAEEATRVDLKSLAKSLGAGRFSFAKPDAMRETLGVAPGAVTPFGLLNDAGRRVRFVLDEALMAHDDLNFHPLTNEATTTIAREDFLRFLADLGVVPLIVPLAAP